MESEESVGEKGARTEPRFRRMFLTMENYQKHGLDHEAIRKAIQSFTSLVYGCFDLEVSNNGVPHAHVYLVFGNQVRVSTVKNVFGDFIHIDKARGVFGPTRRGRVSDAVGARNRMRFSRGIFAVEIE